MHAIFMKKINQVKCEELRYRMFTEKNFGGDRLPSTFDELVLPLRRALIFFHYYLFRFFAELFFFIDQTYKI